MTFLRSQGGEPYFNFLSTSEQLNLVSATLENGNPGLNFKIFKFVGNIFLKPEKSHSMQQIFCWPACTAQWQSLNSVVGYPAMMSAKLSEKIKIFKLLD